MTLGAQMLPEYGGDSGGFSQTQITRERRAMKRLKTLLADVLLFQTISIPHHKNYSGHRRGSKHVNRQRANTRDDNDG